MTAVAQTGADQPGTDRRAVRRAAKIAVIVHEAWALSRTEGLAGIPLRDLADRVGLRQPSLYAYFDSKLALYDAMFADANRQLL
ncbi:MAG: TetR/AcrR family transcriptional regulator, partial [Glaciihabitans sp.]|nr:TetR/AcrR family transcriptional regulator [Glaciihabitans sp.]